MDLNVFLHDTPRKRLNSPQMYIIQYLHTYLHTRVYIPHVYFVMIIFISLISYIHVFTLYRIKTFLSGIIMKNLTL